jgi:endonuclease/exonuclease/phosphatase (EEP) superfamily protein YafD
MRTVLAWLLALACAAWAAVRLLGLESGFPLVPLMALTPYVAVAALVVVVIDVLLRRRLPALVAAVAALVLVAVVAPRALGGPTEPQGGPGATLRVLTVNMHLGNGSAPALVDLVRRTHADVLYVQELTSALVVALNDAGLGAVMPYNALHPDENASGTGMYGRMPLGRTPPGTPSERFGMVWAPARVGGSTIDLIDVHPAAPERGEVGNWDSDMRALPPAEPDGRLRIMAGDFNATLDHDAMRRVLDTGYEDAADVVGAGLQPTWPAGKKVPAAVAIDHVLADKRVGVRAVSVHTVPGTDHRAVFAELRLPGR